MYFCIKFRFWRKEYQTRVKQFTHIIPWGPSHIIRIKVQIGSKNDKLEGSIIFMRISFAKTVNEF